MFGIILLLVGVNVSGDIDTKEVSTVSFNGNILYVGGSGPNNYSKIQDAIDDALDGDTVFVYDDSSPYYEVIEIHTRINLIGEDRNATIIDGGGAERIVGFYSTAGLVKNFTILNGNEGIYLSGNLNAIDNITFDACMLYSCHGGIITSCEISNCEIGIFLEDGSADTEIWFSYIHNNTIGIEIDDYFIQIFNCRFNNNEQGLINYDMEVYVTNCVFNSNINGIIFTKNIDISHCDFINNTGFGVKCTGIERYRQIYGCNFINNNYGIELSSPIMLWRFRRNNFISNNAHFHVDKSSGMRFIFNRYRENYFDDWDDNGPYHIYGFLNWDLHPASEPYDIEV